MYNKKRCNNNNSFLNHPGMDVALGWSDIDQCENIDNGIEKILKDEERSESPGNTSYEKNSDRPLDNSPTPYKRKHKKIELKARGQVVTFDGRYYDVLPVISNSIVYGEINKRRK